MLLFRLSAVFRLASLVSPELAVCSLSVLLLIRKEGKWKLVEGFKHIAEAASSFASTSVFVPWGGGVGVALRGGVTGDASNHSACGCDGCFV